jgi:hypothetical protein
VLLVTMAKTDFLDALEMMEEMEILVLKETEGPPEPPDQLVLPELLEQKVTPD